MYDVIHIISCRHQWCRLCGGGWRFAGVSWSGGRSSDSLAIDGVGIVLSIERVTEQR